MEKLILLFKRYLEIFLEYFFSIWERLRGRTKHWLPIPIKVTLLEVEEDDYDWAFTQNTTTYPDPDYIYGFDHYDDGVTIRTTSRPNWDDDDYTLYLNGDNTRKDYCFVRSHYQLPRLKRAVNVANNLNYKVRRR